MRLSVLLPIIPLALAAPAERSDLAPLVAPADAKVIPNQYIVTFKSANTMSASGGAVAAAVSNARHVYSNVMNGFAGPLDQAALDALRKHPDVSYTLILHFCE